LRASAQRHDRRRQHQHGGPTSHRFGHDTSILHQPDNTPSSTFNGAIGCFRRSMNADRAFVIEDERLVIFASARLAIPQNAPEKLVV
jgi:hypothetical protein